MRYISTWKELEELEPSKTHRIVDDGGCGLWIVPIGEELEESFGAHYLSSHAFYKKSGTPNILKEFGWDVELVPEE